MKSQIITISLLTFFLTNLQAQPFPTTTNQGIMTVEEDTVFSTYFDFENQTSGSVKNNGKSYFFSNFKNDAVFNHDKKGTIYFQEATTQKAIYELPVQNVKNLTGQGKSEFYNVIFDKTQTEDAPNLQLPTDVHSFNLSNNVEIMGRADFENGIINVEKSTGNFIFLQGAVHNNVRNESHVRGAVSKIGDEGFTYPIGKGGFYRFATISAPDDFFDAYHSEYFLENSDNKYPHQYREENIYLINNKEYWTITQSSKGETVLVTLSWDDSGNTTPSEIYANDVQDLHVVRWDDKEGRWFSEGGVVDATNKTVTTVANVQKLGVFTLGKVRENTDTDIIVYNGITPNDDDTNEYWVIKNIEKFPNHVKIFNRWGKLVFKATDYRSPDNVFKGFARNGKVVYKDMEKLPAGTYFYIIEYQKNGIWKDKQGWLYLGDGEYNE